MEIPNRSFIENCKLTGAKIMEFAKRVILRHPEETGSTTDKNIDGRNGDQEKKRETEEQSVEENGEFEGSANVARKRKQWKKAREAGRYNLRHAVHHRL